MSIRTAIPWWGRIGAKLVLSRLPIPYRFWQAVSVFRHGAMDDAAYALAVWARHWRAAGMEGRSGAAVVEIGPGDSLVSALSAYAHDVARCRLVDTGRFARLDPAPYRAVAKLLRDRGLRAPANEDLAPIGRLLEVCRASYETEGVRSLAAIPTASVDLVWSQATLEHVRRAEVPLLLAETRRILKPGGKASHVVDLTDHMGGGLNQHRFAERFWENDRIARSGFYTNRLSHAGWLRAYEAAGFTIATEHVMRFESPPLDERRIVTPLRFAPPEELLVSGFDVVLM